MDISAGIVLSTLLLILATLHFTWASGNTWPFRNKKELIRKVFSDSTKVPQTPPPALTALVGLALVAAAYGSLAIIFPELQIPFIPEWMYLWVMRLFAGIMLLRGVVEPIVYVFKYAAPEYQKLDRLVYAPLCIMLAVLTLAITS